MTFLLKIMQIRWVSLKYFSMFPQHREKKIGYIFNPSFSPAHFGSKNKNNFISLPSMGTNVESQHMQRHNHKGHVLEAVIRFREEKWSTANRFFFFVTKIRNHESWKICFFRKLVCFEQVALNWLQHPYCHKWNYSDRKHYFNLRLKSWKTSTW